MRQVTGSRAPWCWPIPSSAAQAAGAFDMRLPEAERQGFLRAGHRRIWHMNSLQSFTPLRFTVPDASNHCGMALVVDLDIVAVGDVGELPARGRQGRSYAAGPARAAMAPWVIWAATPC